MPRRKAGTSRAEVKARLVEMLDDMAEGAKLPPLVELARRLGYAQVTVSGALQDLAKGADPKIVLIRGKYTGYRKMYDPEQKVREFIAELALPPGDQIPSPAELAKTLGMEEHAVLRVLRILRNEGTLDSRRGSKGGYFMAANPGTRKLSADELKRELRKLISRLQLEPGERLPAIKQIIADYGVWPNVARQALVELCDEGRLFSRLGRDGGYFVAERVETGGGESS